MKSPTKTKGFVLLSGGIDSTTCLHTALAENDSVEAISVDYGQRHKKELIYARNTCHNLQVKHSVLDISGLMSGKGIMLTDTEAELPDISYSEIKGISPMYVPFRNGLLLSLLAAQAQKWVMAEIDDQLFQAQLVGADRHVSDLQEVLQAEMRDSALIYIGAHAEDAANWAYPDCTVEFTEAMTEAINVGTYFTVNVEAPLINLNKAEVIAKGHKLGVAWEDTWSCYAGGEHHCGTCATCRARKQAFKDAGVEDPTVYAQ